MYNLWLPIVILFTLIGCDNGLEPPSTPETGTLEGTISYEGPWPADSTLFDLRFVAMRIIPQSADDIVTEFGKQRVQLSQGLKRPAERDTFQINFVPTGPYVYSGVAIQQTTNIFDWLPVGLYNDDAGIFKILPNETTRIHVHVDFNNIPPFPPVSN